MLRWLDEGRQASAFLRPLAHIPLRNVVVDALRRDTHILPKASLGILPQSQNSWSGILASVQHCFLEMFSSCENRPVFVGFKGTRFRLNLRVEIKYIQMYHYTNKRLFSAITFGKRLKKKKKSYIQTLGNMDTFNINMKKN